MCEMGVPAQPIAIVTKGQKMKAFQKTKIVVCDRITLDGQTVEMSDRRALRDLSAKLFEPIAQAIEQNK